MLSSYTSSEKDIIPTLRIFTQNVRNNNEVLSCLEIPLTSMHVLRTSSPGSRPRLVSYPFKKALQKPVRMSLITVFI